MNRGWITSELAKVENDDKSAPAPEPIHASIITEKEQAHFDAFMVEVK